MSVLLPEVLTMPRNSSLPIFDAPVPSQPALRVSVILSRHPADGSRPDYAARALRVVA
jgi:hypothetical protein